MSLPPERISVKRRRQEDPVDALYLQENSSNNQKRRFTEYYFKLLRDATTTPASPKRVQSQHVQPSSAPSPAVDSSGIPTVHASAPGDEVEDFRKLLAAREARRHDEKHEVPGQPDRTASGTVQSSTKPSTPTVHLQHARRFHLARTLSSFYRPDSSGGIRKAAHKIRPPVPTFIERQSALFTGLDLPPEPPVDRMLDAPHSKKAPAGDVGGSASGESPPSSVPDPTATTFVKPMQPKKKWGTSINDHPSTWDLESDQLADELSALAMEMDDESGPAPLERNAAAVPQQQNHAKPEVDMPDDFVYETYVRFPRDDAVMLPTVADPAQSTYGLIVIDQEDEELWQQYMEEEDDSDRDEEDSNAEDNPANDYPEEEVSSDDEFDRAAYNHRQYASDDEEYGDGSEDD